MDARTDDRVSCGTGTVLMDTGVGIAHLTPPVGSSVGPLAACPSTGLRQCAPNGTVVTLYLPDQSAPVAVYSFVVGQSDNPLRPDGVVMVNGSAVLLNTSRHFLGGFDLIYEADGFVGYRWTGNASGAHGGMNAAAGGPCCKRVVQSAVHPASAEVGSERD